MLDEIMGLFSYAEGLYMLTSLVKSKYQIVIAAVRTIETADLLIERSSIFKTMTDIEQGRGTRTEGEISVFHLTEGKNKGKYLVEDGYHRLFLLLLGHQTKIKVNITGYGSEINTDLATPLKPLKINPSLKYMGLEDLADVEILEELAQQV
jgi:hypothetical protein